MEAFNTNENLEKSLELEVSTLIHFMKVCQIYVRVYLANYSFLNIKLWYM